MSDQRRDFLKWDEYFMGIALLSAERSKDPNTCVGACIVSADNKILSVGYNGMPKGCSDDEYPWAREGDTLETKYVFVCHAELNAILNYKGTDLNGSRVYTTLFPCNECTKALIQAGVSEVVYYSDKYQNTVTDIAAKKMFKSAGVKLTKYEPQNPAKKITLEL